MATQEFSAYAATLPAAGSGLWISGMPVNVVIYVDAFNGSDTTGKRGRMDLPFLTLDNAILATGITSGDLIYLRNGSYTTVGTILVPNGVSVWGESMFGVNVTQGAATNNIIQPGAGTLNNLCVFGNMTVTGAGTGGPIGISSTTGSTVTSSYVLLKNLNIVGGGDCLYFSGTFGAAYWRAENCYFSSGWDTFAGGISGGLSIDFVNCVWTIVNQGQGSPLRAWNQSAGGVIRDWNGVISVTGTTTSHIANAIVAGGTVELHGTSITVAQTTSGKPIAISGGGTVIYDSACSFDLSKVSVAGTIRGKMSQFPGTTGTVAAAGPADGSGPTIALTTGSTDTCGAVNITLGTSPTTGVLAVVGFGQPKLTTFPVLSPGNAATAALMSTTLWPYTISLPAINITPTSTVPSPNIVGVYVPSGINSGQPYYTSAAAGYTLWWNGTNWIISTVAGTNGTNWWQGGTSIVNPYPANGNYTAQTPATGTVAGAFSGAGGFLIDSGSSPLSGGPFSFNYQA